MIRVRIIFVGSTVEQDFYADSSYNESNEGRIVYWNNSEKGELYAYPIQSIFKIIEEGVE